MADPGSGLTNLLTAIQNGVAAANNLVQLLTQATVSSSSLRVQIAGVVTQVNTGAGLTGGPITSTGTISLLSSIGTVTQVNSGTGLTGGPITTTGTLAVSLSTLTNSISSDVALNNTANYFDGPSVAQGTSGTWLAVGQATVLINSLGDNIFCKLWDGTTVIDSGSGGGGPVGNRAIIHLSGVLASPSSNIKISCRDPNNTTAIIKFNDSGNSKDSTVSVVRIG